MNPIMLIGEKHYRDFNEYALGIELISHFTNFAFENARSYAHWDTCAKSYRRIRYNKLVAQLKNYESLINDVFNLVSSEVSSGVSSKVPDTVPELEKNFDFLLKLDNSYQTQFEKIKHFYMLPLERPQDWPQRVTEFEDLSIVSIYDMDDWTKEYNNIFNENVSSLNHRQFDRLYNHMVYIAHKLYRTNDTKTLVMLRRMFVFRAFYIDHDRSEFQEDLFINRRNQIMADNLIQGIKNLNNEEPVLAIVGKAHFDGIFTYLLQNGYKFTH